MSPLRRKLLREIGRRKGQFAAIVLTALLGTALFGASFDAWRNLKASYDQVFVELAMADFTVGGVGSDQRSVLAGVDGVATVTERDVAELVARVDRRAVAARLVGYPAGEPPELNRIRLQVGALPTTGSEVIVEKHLAEAFSLAPGDELSIALADGWRSVTISGVAASAEYLWPARSRQEILVPPDQWGVLFVPPALAAAAPAGTVSHQLLVGYAPGVDRSALDAQLRGAAARIGATDAFARADQPSNAALQEDINGFGEMSLMFPMLFLGVSGMAVYILLGRLVRAQRAEIGVLMALGLQRRRVLSHYLSFGLLAALAGAIPGAILGLALGGLITDLYTGTLGIPTRVINFYPETPLIGLAFATSVGLLAALVPAVRAARLTPAAAMSGASVAVGGESLVERIFPPLRALPSRWKLVVRGIGRSRARSAATIVGIMLAITLVLTSWGLLDTVEVLVDRQFNQIERQSLEAVTLGPVSAAQVDQAAAIAGVAAAEPIARLQVGLTTPSGSYGTALVGFEPNTQMHTFRAADGSALELPATGLLVGDALRSRLGVSAGDPVTITTEGGAAASATVAGFVHEPLGTYAYASLDYLRQTLGPAATDRQTQSIFVSLTPTTSKSAISAALADVTGVATVVDSDSVRRLLDQFMGLFYAFVGVMFVLGAVLAFALIYATISANVSERTVELANLRASGMSAVEIGRLISAENLLLTTIGIVPGLVVGYAGATVFMAAFSSDLFAFDLQVRPISFVMAAAAALAAVALSLWPALRAVARVDLGKVVRERAT